MKDRIKTVPWNLAIIDEAHNLRNAWRPRNVLGQKIKAAFEGVKKLLLTATPLPQNNLIELFGLTSLIDDNIFGEASQFRKDYGGAESDLSDLRKRITPFVQRTLPFPPYHRHASTAPGSTGLPAPHDDAWRDGAGRLGALRPFANWARPPATHGLRAGPVLVAADLLAVLPRRAHGELFTRAHGGIPGVERSPAHSALR